MDETVDLFKDEYINLNAYTTAHVLIAITLAFILLPMIIQVIPKFRKYGSKKFLVSIGIVLTVFWLTWVESISGDQAAILFALVGGGYNVVNVANYKLTNNVKKDALISRKYIIAFLIMGATAILGSYEKMMGGAATGSLVTVATAFGLTNAWAKGKFANLIKADAEATKE